LPPDVSGVQLRPHSGREDEAVILPERPGGQLFASLALAVFPQRFTSRVGQSKGPA
jgi:hypothetical protein